MKLLILHLSSTDYQRVDHFSGLWHTRHAFSVAAETWVRNMTHSKSSGFQNIIIKGFPVFSKFITTANLTDECDTFLWTVRNCLPSKVSHTRRQESSNCLITFCQSSIHMLLENRPYDLNSAGHTGKSFNSCSNSKMHRKLIWSEWNRQDTCHWSNVCVCRRCFITISFQHCSRMVMINRWPARLNVFSPQPFLHKLKFAPPLKWRIYFF